MVGAWTLENMETARLPQEAASAFSQVTENIAGAGYIHILYCSKQL